MSKNREMIAIGIDLGLKTAKTLQTKKLASFSDVLNDFLDGGFPFGAVTELGLPLGCEARSILCSFIANATSEQQLLTYWVSCHEDCSVYPPAWFARGVNPSRILFSTAKKPVEQLKRALINPVFKVIVLDSPKSFKKEDCSFLSRQAKKNGQVIILIRHFFLSNKQGNIWARLRVNIRKQHHKNAFKCHLLKGLSQRELLVAQGG